MPPPLRTSAYPEVFRRAVEHAASAGEFLIPCRQSKPETLRFRFYGYLRALRAEGSAELADAVTVALSANPPGVRLISRELAADAADIAAALGTEPAETEDWDALFSRLNDSVSKLPTSPEEKP